MKKKPKQHMIAKYLGVQPAVISNWCTGTKIKDGVKIKGDVHLMRRFQLLERGYQELVMDK